MIVFGYAMVGKDIKIVTEIFTPRQLVSILEEVSGKRFELKETSYEQFDRTTNGGPFAAELHGKYVPPCNSCLRMFKLATKQIERCFCCEIQHGYVLQKKTPVAISESLMF